MSDDLSRFYALLERLSGASNQGRPLRQCSGSDGWPARGVYFFFEPGEARRTEPEIARVVRVGTHAVSANSRSTLWGRLRAHRGSAVGAGNHRSSVFRQHVGAAILARSGESLSTWGKQSSAPRAIIDLELEHERQVSQHLGQMSVLWVAVPDEPGASSDRGFIERNAIGLLSNALAPEDPPSPLWLGCSSPRAEIRDSGLWNVNHVQDRYDPRFLGLFESYVALTCRPHALPAARIRPA